MAFNLWSTDPASNTFVGPTFIGEGCPAPNVNDGMRQMMSDMRSAINPSLDAGLAAGTIGQVTGTLLSISALGTAADKMLYSTGPQAFAEAALTAFMRTLLADADAASARATIGAIGVDAMSLAIPGYIRLILPTGEKPMLQWGVTTAGANTVTTITYPTAYTSFSVAVGSAATQDTGASDNEPGVISCATASFKIFSARDNTIPFFWIAVGV